MALQVVAIAKKMQTELQVEQQQKRAKVALQWGNDGELRRVAVKWQ